ncbi:hypothetical protein KCMC57_up30570 [Kitasatospora sp. CMC57]|uniref:Uncharacterized protein n=1 Tax=Kitasatospora sp. CMC57 TaxID=3231513 RepID=A0AB33JVQ9_9ACTN
MARIRTIKPEITQSLSLAEVSLTAERTFVCLLTQVDDEGRHIDHAAIINGVLWALRPEHTPVHCADDLQQLASVGLLCRYTGCDGRQYLHVAKWHEHQKISHPSASRLPSCPVHEHGRRCGKCKGERCAHPAPEDLGKAPESLSGPFSAPVGDTTLPEAAPQTLGRPESGNQAADAGETAGQGTSPELLRRAPEGLVPGSRILDPGSTPKGGGSAAPTPAPSRIPHRDEPHLVAAQATEHGMIAHELVAEYVRAAARARPPRCAATSPRSSPACWPRTSPKTRSGPAWRGTRPGR